MGENKEYCPGALVPYINTHGNVCIVEIVSIEHPEGYRKPMLKGFDKKTGAKVFYPVHISLSCTLCCSTSAFVMQDNVSLLVKHDCTDSCYKLSSFNGFHHTFDALS